MSDLLWIIVGILFSFWLWMVWYSEFMFGKIWMIARGLPVEKINEMEMPKYAMLKGTWNAILVASIMTMAWKYFMFDNIQNYYSEMYKLKQLNFDSLEPYKLLQINDYSLLKTYKVQNHQF